MTTDTLATAHALVAHERFEWRERMRTLEGYTVVAVDLGEPEPLMMVEDRSARTWQDSVDGHVPDLADDATAGVLVGVLHESVSCDVSIFSGFKGERRVYQIRGLAWAGAAVRNDPDGRGAQPLCKHLGVAVALALLAVWPTPDPAP